MSISVTWLGHATFLIETENHNILLDPFLDGSPTASAKAADIECDTMLISHGHEDHVADAVSIAKRTGCVVYSNFEICQWLGNKHGVENTVAMNLGGGVAASFGRIEMTLAHHSSSLPDGSYAGNPAGFLLTINNKKIYFACDTALFSEMAMIGAAGLDLAVLPIGDCFTMGPDAAFEAVKLLSPRFVIPCHYNTWPPIEQDAAAWAKRVDEEATADAKVLSPGESLVV